MVGVGVLVFDCIVGLWWALIFGNLFCLDWILV